MTKTIRTDSQGRLNLGKQYASSIFIVEELDKGELVLKKAAVISEKELCLLRNADIFKSIQKGLGEAKAGQLLHMDSEEFED